MKRWQPLPMFSKILCRPRMLALGLAFVHLAQGGEPAIIAKARAYLGSEAALNAVKSVHYTGSIITKAASEPSKESRATLEIIAQKPDQQRVVTRSDTAIETTSVDGYEAWQRHQETANPKNQRLIVMKPDAVKRLRAQAWENLYFFHGLERDGGRVEDQGIQTIDGVSCQKVAFIHAPTIFFIRYFDVATGRLVQTETDDGAVTREEGERIVGGVRFPRSMQMTLRNAKGEQQLVTVSFDSVTLNEPFPDAVFRMPSPSAP